MAYRPNRKLITWRKVQNDRYDGFVLFGCLQHFEYLQRKKDSTAKVTAKSGKTSEVVFDKLSRPFEVEDSDGNITDFCYAYPKRDNDIGGPEDW